MSGQPARRARRVRRRAPSQNFLRSPRLAEAIVRDAQVGEHDLVVEIGAGTGRLTAPLAERAREVCAIELDPVWAERLRARFRARPGVTVVEGDALRVPLPQRRFRVVANLPFHRTSAFLRLLLDDPELPLERADLIVEWGVACKRAARWPSTLQNVVWGSAWELTVGRRLPAVCFEPKPAVDAGLLRVVRRVEPLVATGELRCFRAFVAAGFGAPSLTRTVPRHALRRVGRELGFAPTAQARELDLHQWVGLFDAVHRARYPSARHAPL